MFAEGWRGYKQRLPESKSYFSWILEDPFIAAKGKQCQETSLMLVIHFPWIFLNFSVFIFYAV